MSSYDCTLRIREASVLAVLCLTCLAWACTPPSTSCPEATSSPSCPEMYTVRSTTTAWLRGGGGGTHDKNTGGQRFHCKELYSRTRNLSRNFGFFYISLDIVLICTTNIWMTLTARPRRFISMIKTQNLIVQWHSMKVTHLTTAVATFGFHSG